MRIPKEFYVKGRLWQTVYKWNLRDDDGNPCDGLCDHISRIVYIEHALSKAEKPSVFHHELFHAICHESHVSGVDGGLDPLVEELLAEAFQDFIGLSWIIRWKRKSR